jgi:hypothetical protein
MVIRATAQYHQRNLTWKVCRTNFTLFAGCGMGEICPASAGPVIIRLVSLCPRLLQRLRGVTGKTGLAVAAGCNTGYSEEGSVGASGDRHPCHLSPPLL